MYPNVRFPKSAVSVVCDRRGLMQKYFNYAIKVNFQSNLIEFKQVFLEYILCQVKPDEISQFSAQNIPKIAPWIIFFPEQTLKMVP